MDLDALRQEAIDHLRASRWAELLALETDLATDVDYWATAWGLSCAVAAYHLGRDDAVDRLEALIDVGFHDIAMHDELFADTFATLPDWPGLRARIVANRPPPPIELVDWPTATPHHPLGLDRLPPDEEGRLAARLPAATSTALGSALALLDWVTHRWRHTGANHVDSRSAHEVLDRVADGERFACREYTILLTQGLNAIGIPARVLAVYRDGYHAGMGTGHAVTEAWIDDLGRWIVLDGQNGSTWRDADGEPLGVAALQAMHAAGLVARLDGSGPNVRPGSDAEWMSYFASCSTGGMSWRPGGYVPVSEAARVVASSPLLRSATPPSPDLAEIATHVVEVDGGAAVRFTTTHPYAAGFTISADAGTPAEVGLESTLDLRRPAGLHRWRVATRTAYGSLSASELVVRTT